RPGPCPARGPTQPVREPRREARPDAAPAPVRQLEGSRPQRPVLREESSVAPVFAIASREIAIHPPGGGAGDLAVAREALGFAVREVRDFRVAAPLVEKTPAVPRPEPRPVVEA